LREEGRAQEATYDHVSRARSRQDDVGERRHLLRAVAPEEGARLAATWDAAAVGAASSEEAGRIAGA